MIKILIVEDYFIVLKINKVLFLSSGTVDNHRYVFLVNALRAKDRPGAVAIEMNLVT
jgi:hypothetical protein